MLIARNETASMRSKVETLALEFTTSIACRRQAKITLGKILVSGAGPDRVAAIYAGARETKRALMLIANFYDKTERDFLRDVASHA